MLNKSFKTLFTLFLGILFFILTFIASSAEVEISGYSKEISTKLEEIKYLHESGFISKDEFTKAKEIILKEKEENKELASLKENKKKELTKFGSSKSKKKKKQVKNLFKKKEEEEEEISIEDLDELGVYQPIKEYPESMIKFFGNRKNFTMRSQKAGKYLYMNFTRSKSWAQKKPGNMMKAMAMYEIFYLSKLKSTKRNLDRYKRYWPNDYGYKKNKDEKAIRSLMGINKGRKKMRGALGIDMEAPIEDAIKRFWVLGEFLSLGEPKKLAKLSPEMKERHELIEGYKLAIMSLKTKLENDAETAAKKDKKK